jgi:hypothetical protein
VSPVERPDRSDVVGAEANLPRGEICREGRVLFVQFSDDGVVREAIERHDHERDPENDPWG